MQGLSSDIQSALDVVIEGLDYKFEVDLIEPDKVKESMDSKLDSFRTAKELLEKWVNSPNAPGEKRFSHYVQRIIDTGESSVEILRKALRAKVDFSSLEEHKHKKVAKTKLEVLKSIHEMDSSLQELKLQLETGTVNLKEAEFERGWAEKFAYGEFYPVQNYNTFIPPNLTDERGNHLIRKKEWHNEEEDAIIIDPRGTRGEIVTLGGLNIQLPSVPRDKSKILFSDKPKKDQYWRREPLPKGCTPSNVEVYTEYILEEFRRRREGLWFMNNGKPVWLTPWHYMQLQWGKMKDGDIYPSYREAQRDLSYHKLACWVDPRCMGQIFLKSRQTGYTYGALSDSLCVVTSSKNSRTGLTSMKDEDAERAWQKLAYTYQEWPFFFQPILKGSIDSPTKYEWKKPSNNTKEQKKRKETSNDGYVNSITDYEATKAKSYDGQTLFLYVGDECYSPDTKILTENGQFSRVSDLNVGDKVMCADGVAREIYQKREGVSFMYKIKQAYGKDYVVSQRHKLIFDKYERGGNNTEIIMTPEDYLRSSKTFKSKLKRKIFRGYEKKEVETFLDPYLFGVWLGDGTSREPQFVVNHKKDKEILKSLQEFCSSKDGLSLTELSYKGDNFKRFYIKDDIHYSRNRVTEELRGWGVLNNKRIPKNIYTFSLSQRLNILAGIIDSDGYKNGRNGYEIKMSREDLVNDIYNLCGTIGLNTSLPRKHKSGSYIVHIKDEFSIIPVKIKRKRAEVNSNQQTPRLKILGVEKIGLGDYCGITIKSDSLVGNRVVLEDFTVTSNCAKWESENYIEHVNTLLPTTFRGGRVVGKMFLGSTMGKLDKGGNEFKTLYTKSKVEDRMESGFTYTKLYAYFMPAQTNYEEAIDKYGKCWEETPPKGTLNVFGREIKKGSIEMIQDLYEEARNTDDVALNAAYRAFPMTEEHAMRDEAEECVFNLTKLMDQWDSNVADRLLPVTRGNFTWKDGKPFTEAIFQPDERGRFKVHWMPNESDGTAHLRNNVALQRNLFVPQNDYGAIGVDCYGSFSKGPNRQSKGAAHAATKDKGRIPNGVPANRFLFEYVDKPATQDIFDMEILCAAWFYGLPILAENNRRDHVRFLYNNRCRPFSMNRVDKLDISGDDLVLGGQPMTSKDIKDSHENAIRTYIIRHVGHATEPEGTKYRKEGEMGIMPFNETIMSWQKFNPASPTEYDATISSGLALIACDVEKYKPSPKKRDPKKYVSLLRKYKNNGNISIPVRNG